MNAVSVIGVVSAFGLLFLSLLALFAEKGMHPCRRVRSGFQRLPAWEKMLLSLFVSVWIAFAGLKEGGWTNCVNQVEGETNMVTQIEGNTNVLMGVVQGRARSPSAPQVEASGESKGPALRRVRGTLPTEMASITSDDVAQLWRIDATVDGNAFAEPTANAVTNAAWLDYGGMSDSLRIKPDGWWFPFGNGTTTGLTVFENGEFRPNVKTHFFPPPFDAQLSLVPRMNWPLIPGGGESVFWHEQTPSNSLVLTWHNALYNRDINCPTNFQAELFADGRFDYRYDDHAVKHAPVFPFDFDDDGLENSVDPEPLVAGPDAHGTNAEWHGMVCSNIFTKVEQPNSQPILLPNRESVYFKLDVNTNAYYFVDVVVGSPAPIYFKANGESNLGNPIVVARAGEINRVPMLIGATYSISSSVPVNVSLPIDGHAEILHLTESVCSVVWPLHLDLTGTAAASECEYSLTVGPFDPGGQIVWEEHGHLMMGEGEGQSGSTDCQCVTYDGSCAYFRCGSHCSCGGTCRARGYYWLEGMNFPFQGGNCTCGGDAVVVENNNHTLGLSTSVPPCLLLKSGWMDGSCSATVACTATNSELVDREVNVWVASGVVRVESALTAMYSFTVPAGQTVTHSIVIDGIRQSESVDDVAICFSYGDIVGRRTLTVVNPLRIEIPSAPATGLAVLVGSSVSANLITQPQVGGLTVEWYAFGNLLGARNGFTEVPVGMWKCNAFVADMIIEGGGTVPARSSLVGGIFGRNHPPLANEWADSGAIIAGWELLGNEAYPEPGFVVSFPNPLGSGHVGIVDYDGWSVSAREYTVSRNAQKMLDSRCVYRKPILTQ